MGFFGTVPRGEHGDNTRNSATQLLPYSSLPFRNLLISTVITHHPNSRRRLKMALSPQESSITIQSVATHHSKSGQVPCKSPLNAPQRSCNRPNNRELSFQQSPLIIPRMVTLIVVWSVNYPNNRHFSLQQSSLIILTIDVATLSTTLTVPLCNP